MRKVEPKIFLIAYTHLDNDATSKWLEEVGGLKVLDHLDGDDGEKLVELSGRNCYKSFDVGLNPNITKVRTDSQEYHNNILKSAHGSVLEHATATFAFENISRVFSHEVVRHRAGTAFCLAGSTKISIVRSGGKGRKNGTKTRSIKSLYNTFSPEFTLRCLDEQNNCFTTTKIKNVSYSGKKPCFSVTLSDGKKITCSKDHQIFTSDGWKTLNDLVGESYLSSGSFPYYDSKNLSKIAVNGRVVSVHRTINSREKCIYKSGLTSSVKKSASYIVPKFVNISSVEYVGEIDTYDIETTGPHNFLANGIVVHNSQESLRYIRLDNLKYWVPEVIDSNPEARKVFEEVFAKCEWAQKEFARIYDIENMKDFHVKKQLTSAFRRAAPIGLATGIVITFNLRALRWIIQMRTAESAEVEIRKVFCEVYNIAKEKWPFLFQDFTTVDTNDGLFEAKPLMSKV